jgi:hypothetical protein
LESEVLKKSDEAGYLRLEFVLRDLVRGEEVNCVALIPGTEATFTPENWSGKVVVWVHPEGAAGMFDADGSARLEVLRLLDAGFAIVTLDPGSVTLHPDTASVPLDPEATASRGDGEAGTIGKTKDFKEQRRLEAGEVKEGAEWKHHSMYTFGYNDPLFVQRVHDLMSLLVFVRYSDLYPARELVVMGMEGGGKWVAAACGMEGMMGEVVDRVAVDFEGFRFRELESVWDADFVPGAVKYGDVEGLVNLLGDDGEKVWVSGVEGRAEPGEGAVDWVVKSKS